MLTGPSVDDPDATTAKPEWAAAASGTAKMKTNSMKCLLAVLPPAQPDVRADVVEEARKRSEHRLAAMLARIVELGGTADGQIGDSDPVKAVEVALAQGPFDEVVVSTLPLGLSRWVKMDLPSRGRANGRVSRDHRRSPAPGLLTASAELPIPTSRV